MYFRRCLFACLGLALLGVPPPVARAQEQTRPGEGSLASTIISGAGLGAVSFLGGILLTMDSVEGVENTDFIFASAMGALGMAAGVHLGNGRRGNFVKDLLATTLIGAAGIVHFYATGGNEDGIPTPIILATPFLQLSVSVAVERSSGRSRAADKDAQLFLLPQPDGSLCLGAAYAV